MDVKDAAGRARGASWLRLRGASLSLAPGTIRPMTEWDIIDALTDGDVSKSGFTYREAFEWLSEQRARAKVIGFLAGERQPTG